MRKATEPAIDWLGPNSPDPDGNDLLDPIYEPAYTRLPTAVADGTKTTRAGKLEWKWKKL